MTRKDYIRFASLINSHECPMGYSVDMLNTWNECRETFADRLANVLGNDNPKFDRAKFLKACGVES
jgi:hypothetical protein